MVTNEPPNWGLVKADHNVGIQAYLNWRMSKAPNPPTEAEMLDRDPEWDDYVRTIGSLILYQLEKIGGVE